MEETAKVKVYIIGHKNPDTDSICSAIAYADIKSRTEEGRFVAKRAGQISEETQYVLGRFGMEAPGYVPNVGTRVKDMDIRRIAGVSHSISLKKAWNLMRNENVNTLPIVREDNILEGLITISDIAQSYMDVYDNAILATARTQYKNILETLDGVMVEGNEHGYFVKGKVVVAAANPDLMENYIEQDDLVILGNRYESQLCAIEMNAGCIIVCEGAPVSKTIRRLAADKDCAVISTPHDTYTVARLINQSMPVKFFMKKERLLTFELDDYTDSIKDIMAKKRYRDFPILDKHGKYVGMVSRRNLLGMKRRRVILVDHNEASQAVDNIESAEILEIIDHHRLGSLETMAPVYFRNQPVGCTATIMYQIYGEKQLEIPENIAGLLCAAIISDTLMFRSPTCTPADRAAAADLARIAGIECESFATDMFAAGSKLKDKSPEEIFYQDFKKFELNKASFGVGQINSMNPAELTEIKERLIPYLEKALGTHGESMLFFMLTDIIHESTELLCYGGESEELVEEAFHKAPQDCSVVLPGVVSRKKQLIPAFMNALQQ
ncbi:putative manganese-dependent inorganic diphosphatase [Murimonas intestini]|uniref:inorganic diphosphatase n=1 Tax=Murimonas intestini TaxID=1337051 RepID=A0AB73T0K5_9FIRM|nr:putative manganese-dependent inorganic diphosphatase [Murimonas intestini]MCR1840189.1 putative manganese-dependent inorganic diphosphatase [Murimonas intestini]MCR1867641.1 putative manganese-dependent inorganic diphosphatase [Murimonas intestini]MCR1884944.1 putative manganese-dependent inorganic diphosphatase [Murimonas intestini]